MRSRYKRKKSEIEQTFNRAIVELQEKKLPKERKIKSIFVFSLISSFSIEYKKELEEKTAQFRQEINALDEEIRNVQILFIEAYKKYKLDRMNNQDFFSKLI